jgi:hypothetical protein
MIGWPCTLKPRGSSSVKRNSWPDDPLRSPRHCPWSGAFSSPPSGSAAIPAVTFGTSRPAPRPAPPPPPGARPTSGGPSTLSTPAAAASKSSGGNCRSAGPTRRATLPGPWQSRRASSPPSGSSATGAIANSSVVRPANNARDAATTSAPPPTAAPSAAIVVQPLHLPRRATPATPAFRSRAKKAPATPRRGLVYRSDVSIYPIGRSSNVSTLVIDVTLSSPDL